MSLLIIPAVTGSAAAKIEELNHKENRLKIAAVFLENHPELLRQIPNIEDMIRFDGRPRILFVDQKMLALAADYFVRAEVRFKKVKMENEKAQFKA